MSEQPKCGCPCHLEIPGVSPTTTGHICCEAPRYGSRFVPCRLCSKPAREVGAPADCPACGKTLCEACCDARKVSGK
jgi:hypothetical protein